MRSIRAKCGNCPYLQNKTGQSGTCSLQDDELMLLDETCILDYKYITRDMALRILHDLQKWRRGVSGQMIPPFVVGCAIDYSIRDLRKQKKDESNR